MRKMITFLVLIYVALLASSAQSGPKKHYQAYRVTTPPTINGDLDDEAWIQGTWEGGFVQHEPYENRPPSQATEFKICFDDMNLYVGVKALDSSPDSINRRMERRDNADGDMIMILFDSYHDLRTGFLFGLSPVSARFDEIMSNDGASEDTSWDPIWQGKAKVHDWGWAAEMKIPFTQLRFKKNSGEVWGLIVGRFLYRKSEMSLWPAIPRDAPGFIHMAGELGGLDEVKPRKQFDITPYGVASYNSYEAEEGNPFSTGRETRLKGGLDAKIGVSNNLTLDLTMLPDFGQVEADPSEVNLTAFETFFEEKRPFFIEGSNITNFNVGLGDGEIGNDNLFYSRRIGRRPQGEVSAGDDEYSDEPAFTNILGAAKLTGKTQNGFSVGILESVTSEVEATIDRNGQRSSQVIEPLTNYALARIQKDINKGNTIIGGMVTSAIRRLDNTGITDLHKNATTAGLDFEQYFRERNYFFRSRFFLSHVTGSTEAIQKTQESSSRYYQRPDATYLHPDSTRTSLTGTGARLEAGKIGGKWNLMLLSNWKSPGLELNDMGFQREADRITNVLWTGYNFTEPFAIFRSLQLGSDIYLSNDFGGNLLGIGYEWNTNFRFKNYWYSGVGGGFGFRNRSNTILRGGPSMYQPNSWRVWYNISTDNRKKVIFLVYGNVNGEAENVSRRNFIGTELSLRPLNSLKIELSPDYSVRRDAFQYITTESFMGQDRFLFGKINQQVVSASIRVNYTLTPDLTIQYWGQPFLARGSYSEFKRITIPGADELNDRYHLFSDEEIRLDGEVYFIDENLDHTVDYQFDDPDFHVDEWLSNLVVRWEYLPGSTLYFVWSQSRNYNSPVDEFNLFDNIEGLFTGEKANNVFLLKASFRLGVR